MIKLFKTISFVQYYEKSISEMYIASPLWKMARTGRYVSSERWHGIVIVENGD